MTNLSIIISARNDPVGCLVTANSIIQEAKKFSGTYEIIIVDNSDTTHHWQSLRQLIKPVSKQIKLIRQDFPCLFTARETGVSSASGEYLLFLDSHCLIGRDYFVKIFNVVDKLDNLGFLYGLMCYSNHHEHDAYCDRHIRNFIGIRYIEKGLPTIPFPIPFRGMPFLCKRKFFTAIGGYGALAKYRLSWGGGDFLLGLKAMLFGYTNYMLPTASVIHLGPFKRDKYFPSSYIRDVKGSYPRYTGMIAAAYVIGGIELVNNRIKQINNRLNYNITDRIVNLAVTIAEDDRRHLVNNSKLTYNDLVRLFSNQVLYHIPIYKGQPQIPTIGDNPHQQQSISRPSPDNWKDRIINSIQLGRGITQ